MYLDRTHDRCMHSPELTQSPWELPQITLGTNVQSSGNLIPATSQLNKMSNNYKRKFIYYTLCAVLPNCLETSFATASEARFASYSSASLAASPA